MTHSITGDTPIYQLSVNQLLDLLHKKEAEPITARVESSSKNYVYGLDGLSRLLNCSHPTAQRIKDSGKIPFTQVGRKLIFDADAVLAALSKK
jgi:excisionase family DNA binding protein